MSSFDFNESFVAYRSTAGVKLYKNTAGQEKVIELSIEDLVQLRDWLNNNLIVPAQPYIYWPE